MTRRGDRIGFMQGRLSPLVHGKIQAFPTERWRDEFPLGHDLGFERIEWTLDHEGLGQNPLMTSEGRTEIQVLSQRHKLRVGSVTGDCFMQAPFWKGLGSKRSTLYASFESVVFAASKARAGLIVVPLVDNGALTRASEEIALIEGMKDATPLLRRTGVRVAFESDYSPNRLSEFIARFPPDVFGVNLDVGNSASLGWEPQDEIPVLGDRIVNVHIKDRLLGGHTVPLGEGDADFPVVFRLLAEQGYDGALILQTARAADGDHAGALSRYRDMVLDFLEVA